MYIVPCKVQQSVKIGPVTVTILQIRGDRVRMRIEAPDEVSVHRGEIIECLSAAAEHAVAAARSTAD